MSVLMASDAAVAKLPGVAAKLPEVGAKLPEVATKLHTTVTTLDTSMWALFLRAEFIVQLVIVSLVVASVWSWAIIISKTRRLKQLNAAADEFEEIFWSAGSLESLYQRVNGKANDPLTSMFCAAMREWNYAVSKSGTGNIEQRIDRVMQLVISREIAAVERHLGFLASLGSNGVIVGLFGTVLGTMHSFQRIVALQSTNLVAVAPGIAEALFATAIGVVASIPAAVAYNALSIDLNRYANRLDAFSNEFNAIVARQLLEESK
jgi:biopolymer transport protein TolQ